jgi:hypothetical protein
VPVIQTTGAGTATWVSAADMMSLMALILGMFEELTFLILSLWLLFRTAMSFVDAGVKQRSATRFRSVDDPPLVAFPNRTNSPN